MCSDDPQWMRSSATFKRMSCSSSDRTEGIRCIQPHHCQRWVAAIRCSCRAFSSFARANASLEGCFQFSSFLYSVIIALSYRFGDFFSSSRCYWSLLYLPGLHSSCSSAHRPRKFSKKTVTKPIRQSGPDTVCCRYCLHESRYQRYSKLELNFELETQVKMFEHFELFWVH